MLVQFVTTPELEILDVWGQIISLSSQTAVLLNILMTLSPQMHSAVLCSTKGKTGTQTAAQAKDSTAARGSHGAGQASARLVLLTVRIQVFSAVLSHIIHMEVMLQLPVNCIHGLCNMLHCVLQT